MQQEKEKTETYPIEFKLFYEFEHTKRNGYMYNCMKSEHANVNTLFALQIESHK